jgi:hypothetical protein
MPAITPEQIDQKFGGQYSENYTLGVRHGVKAETSVVHATIGRAEDNLFATTEAQWDYLDGWVQGRVEWDAAVEGDQVYEQYARMFTDGKFDVTDMVRFFLADLATEDVYIAIPAAGDPFAAALREAECDMLALYLDDKITADQYLYARGA